MMPSRLGVWTFAILMLGAAGEVHAQTVIPSDRNFPWNPGMMSKGGIPSRTTICATLSPSGGDQSAAIQAMLDRCPSNQVVMLKPGIFIVNNNLLAPASLGKDKWSKSTNVTIP